MKLGNRLKQLDAMIKNDYTQIWDCCCDHGLLGMRLLKREAAEVIHFVDIQASIMQQLESKLLEYFDDESYPSQWKTHCLDIRDLPLIKKSSSSLNKQVIIIAGVGGDQMIEFIDAILNRYPDLNLDFLLCPVHHTYKVRQALIKNKFGLIDEKLVKDNKRFYEIIYVSQSSSIKVSPVGSIMWDLKRAVDQEYLAKTIKHYQLKAKDKNNQVADIISSYQRLANG